MSRWIRWEAPRVIFEVRNAALKSLVEAAEAVLEEAISEVPLQDGDLMRSGIVVPMADGRVAVSFGGGAGTGQSVIPYAVRWHEEQANFQKGRKRHYLRDPAFIKGPGLLLAAMKKNFGGSR